MHGAKGHIYLGKMTTVRTVWLNLFGGFDKLNWFELQRRYIAVNPQALTDNAIRSART